MKKTWTIGVALASVAALIAVPSALAAYTSPKLEVRQLGNAVIIKVSQAAEDDATAALLIAAPEGTTLTTNQAPGTVLGNVNALVIATALGGAQLPITGQVVVAAPGQVPAELVTACLGDDPPTAVWLLVLSAAGQQLTLPLFLISDPVGLIVCLPHPSTATFGAKLIQAEFSVAGVFSPTTQGVWLSIWVPWNADGSDINQAGTVASPAAIAPGALSVAARRAGARGVGAIVSGRVTQAGGPRGGATVQIFGGATRSNLRRIGRVRTNAAGAFTFRARAGTFFRATATATGGAAPPLCTVIGPAIAPIPCVNPTVNGFTAQSRVVRKR